MVLNVDAAGEPTTDVVVAVVIGVFVLPGVIVAPLRSTHDAWTSVVTAAEVITLRRSEVDASSSIRYPLDQGHRWES